jgi:hypothetical protein
MSTGEGWDELCDRWDISLAVVDRRPGPRGDYGLRRRLRSDPDWVCVFFTHNALVYARRGARDEVIARHGSPFDPGEVTVAAIHGFVSRSSPEDVGQALNALSSWLDIVPGDRFLTPILAQMLDTAGRSADAAPHLRRLLRHDPSAVDVRILLARTLLKADSLAAARTEIDALLAGAPDRVESFLLLAAHQQLTGDRDAALATLRRAEAAHPDDPGVRRSLEALERR